MCGIAGVLVGSSGVSGRQLQAVAAMTATLRHRGPDGDGIWLDRAAGVGFGHRRLAIVDLSQAGHQPMTSPGGSLITTYNGEIYNAAELRRELEARGLRFRGHSDTEVMLGAFEEFGIEASLRRFAGMFALGLWDRGTRTLHLMRDCLGKKPLYVALVDSALVFASELRAIVAFPGFSRAINQTALASLLRNGWIPDDQCIYQGVFKLPPGTILSVGTDELGYANAESLRLRARSWWSLADVASTGQREPLGSSAPELIANLDSILRVAVAERMVADVPLGAFLSGGIDSSVVVALMQAQASRPVRTFTIGFDEAAFDEAADAARIARHLGTDHTGFRIAAADARAIIPDLPLIWDEPFADESQIPTLLVSQLARRSVTVALSGDGGDECFGGYTRHVQSARLAQLLRLPVVLRAGTGAALHWGGGGALGGRIGRYLGNAQVQKFARALGAPDESTLYDRLTTTGRRSLALVPEGAMAYAGPALPDAPGRFMFRDMVGYLPGDILVKLDRATMAVGLEGRCPLLDRRVVEFAWRVPTALKVRNGKGKWLLRRILRRYVPEALFERPKQGFNVPVGTWLRGPLRDWAEALLAETRLRQEGLLDPAGVRACWRDHLDGHRDRSAELWAVLMAQAWLQRTQGAAPAGSDAERTGFEPVVEHATAGGAHG